MSILLILLFLLQSGGPVKLQDYAVWDLSPAHSSGYLVDSALKSLGYSGVYSVNPEFADSIFYFKTLWIFLGFYPHKFVIKKNSQIFSVLQSYLENHRKLLIDCGDCFFYDPLYENAGELSQLLGIVSQNEGYPESPKKIKGVPGTFLNGLTFECSGKVNYPDRIFPDTSSYPILESQDQSVFYGIASTINSSKVLALNLPLSNMQFGDVKIFVQRVMEFFLRDSLEYDVALLSVLSPYGIMPLDTPIVPRILVSSLTGNADSVTFYFQVFSKDSLIYCDSTYVEPLVENDTLDLNFKPFVIHKKGKYRYQTFLKYPEDQNGLNDTIKGIFNVASQRDYLILDLDPDHSSAPMVKNILDSLGLVGVYSRDSSYDSLSLYHTLWIFTGMFPLKFKIGQNSSIANLIQQFVGPHKGLYLEGGDVWFWDPLNENAFDPSNIFGIEPTGDGFYTPERLKRIAPPPADTLEFVYKKTLSYPDHLKPKGKGFPLLFASHPEFYCGIATLDSQNFRTVGLSVELGKIQDSTEKVFELVSEIASFLMDTISYWPGLKILPDSFNFLAFEGETLRDSISIQNTGNFPLYFQIKISDSRNPVSIPLLKRFRGKRGTLKGTISLHQGENPFYLWKDSFSQYGPDYEWFEISSLGTPIELSDDNFVAKELPWPFEFFGFKYTRVLISSNGYLTFGEYGSQFLNDTIPSPDAPDNFIAPFWDDLDATNGGVYFYGDTEKVVVEWKNVSASSAPAFYTFEVVLWRNGKINFEYQNIPPGYASATIGIENPDGTQGICVGFNVSSVPENYAIEFLPKKKWLVLSQKEEGFVLSNETSYLKVSVLAPDTTPFKDSLFLIFKTNAGEKILPLSIKVLKKGDINVDGKVDGLDLTELVNYLFYNGELYRIELADLNQDGKVNPEDLVYLVKILENSKGFKVPQKFRRLINEKS